MPSTVDTIKANIRENKAQQRDCGYRARRGDQAARKELYALRVQNTELDEQLKAAKFAARTPEDIHVDELIELRKRVTKEEQVIGRAKWSRRRAGKTTEAKDLEQAEALIRRRRAEVETEITAARKVAKLSKALGQGGVTCSCCLSARKPNDGGGIPRHGWQVVGHRHPGEWGNTWHTDGCAGDQHPPLEKSPAGSLYMLNDLAYRQEAVRNRLTRLIDERPPLSVIKPTSPNHYGGNLETLFAELEQHELIKKIDSRIDKHPGSSKHWLDIFDGYPGHQGRELSLPSYEQLHTKDTAACESELKSLHRYREDLRAAVVAHGWAAELDEYDRSRP